MHALPADFFEVTLPTSADAAALALFGARVFEQTFRDDPDHRPADMRLYLAQTYTPPAIDRHIADPAVTYWIARLPDAPNGDAERGMIGYAKLCRGAPPPCVSLQNPLEIAQFYVDFCWHRRGVAQALMHKTLETAVASGCDGLWLGVWHRNYRAQQFYAKFGFRRVGEHPFQFGNDRQTDLVFESPLSDSPRPAAPPAGATERERG